MSAHRARLRRHRREVQRLSRFFVCCWILALCRAHVAAQDNQRNEFWPELDVYVNIKPKLRLFLLATSSKSTEDGELLKAGAFEAQFGPHLDYVLSEHLMLRVGYRYGTSIGDADEFREHRVLTEQTLRKHLTRKFLLSDRNREDFRFLLDGFSFRYRNRLMLEREFQLADKRGITPYVSAETFYDTRYDVWNKTRFTAGVQIALKRRPLDLLPKHHTILDVYYMRVHDTRSSTPHVNGLGLALAFYF